MPPSPLSVEGLHQAVRPQQHGLDPPGLQRQRLQKWLRLGQGESLLEAS